MNTVFFALWLLLSIGLIYFMGWTMYVLHRQKEAWKKFSVKHKLRYKSLRGFLSPEVSGVYQGYTVSIFTGEHKAEDIRGSRKMTAIEINLNSVFPFSGSVASGQGMIDVVESMGFVQEIVPKIDGWDKEFVARADKKGAFRGYLSNKRLQALLSILKIKNAWIIFIFKGDTTLLRLDTPQPLDKIEVLEKLLGKMIAVANVLELQDGEVATLKDAMSKEDSSEVSIDVDDVFENTGLEIDDGSGA